MTDTAPLAAADPVAPSALPARIRAFLAEPNFATIATVGTDGTPNQAVVWYRFDDASIVINSAVGRRWPANLVRDGRISVAVLDRHDGMRWVGFTSEATPIRGRATAQADIAEMARRYHADDPQEGERIIRERFQRQERISFRIAVGAVHDHLD
jgi:PPOX class probable F420-dependent enzyme